MRIEDLVIPSCLPIAIDIGSSSVRLMQLRRRGRRLSIVGATRHEWPAGSGVAAGAAPVDAIVNTVSSGIESGSFVGKRCVLSIDNRLIRVRSVRHPPMPDDELDRAVRLEAPARLGFAEAEEIEIGWIRAGSVRQVGDPRDEVLVFGALSDRIREMVFALSRAGLHPVAVEPSFVGCARAFTRRLRRSADRDTVNLVVDIGEKTTGVIVTRGQTVVLYKLLEMGGASMTAAAAERLSLAPQSVLDLRRRRIEARVRGESSSDARIDRALFEAVRPIMGDLANEVALCMRYYGVTFRGPKPEGCMLAGGNSGEPRLTEIIQEAVRLPVTVGAPLEGIGFEPLQRHASAPTAPESAWAPVLGLGLGVLKAGQSVSPEHRRAEDQQAAPAEAAPVSEESQARKAA